VGKSMAVKSSRVGFLSAQRISDMTWERSWQHHQRNCQSCGQRLVRESPTGFDKLFSRDIIRWMSFPSIAPIPYREESGRDRISFRR
jgi:hypothetical protein